MNAQNFGYDHLSTQSFDNMKNIYEKNLSLSEHVSIMNIFCHFSILIELAGTYILLELGSKSTYQISTNFKKKKNDNPWKATTINLNDFTENL